MSRGPARWSASTSTIFAPSANPFMSISLPARALCAALLLTVGASALKGQERPPSTSPEKEAVIRRILDVTRTADLIFSTIEAAMPAQRASNPSIPPVFWDRFIVRARAERRSLIDSLAPVYDRLFTTEELKELLRFYETPLGQRLVAASPDLARESMLVGQRWGFVIGQEIGAQLQRESLVLPPPDEEHIPDRLNPHAAGQ